MLGEACYLCSCQMVCDDRTTMQDTENRRVLVSLVLFLKLQNCTWNVYLQNFAAKEARGCTWRQPSLSSAHRKHKKPMRPYGCGVRGTKDASVIDSRGDLDDVKIQWHRDRWHFIEFLVLSDEKKEIPARRKILADLRSLQISSPNAENEIPAAREKKKDSSERRRPPTLSSIPSS